MGNLGYSTVCDEGSGENRLSARLSDYSEKKKKKTADTLECALSLKRICYFGISSALSREQRQPQSKTLKHNMFQCLA